MFILDISTITGMNGQNHCVYFKLGVTKVDIYTVYIIHFFTPPVSNLSYKFGGAHLVEGGGGGNQGHVSPLSSIAPMLGW